MADEAIVLDVDVADGIEVFAVAEFDQRDHAIVPDQGAIREPDVIANAHQRRVSDVAPRVDVKVVAYRMKLAPAGQVVAPLPSCRVTELFVCRASTPCGIDIIRQCTP
ncbi:hypothetical protein D3C77_645260 [compost metagenome]